MSRGPQHYAEAERLLASCQEKPGTYPSEFWKGSTDYHRNALMGAQVHATLAAAAATIEMALAMQADNGVQVEWIEAVT